MLAMEKLCKWRSVLAGWHTGTRSMTEPGTKAMRDLMDKWLIMRAENNALIVLMVKKKVFSREEFTSVLERTCAELDKDMERMFPGFRTLAVGVEIFDVDIAHKTMRDLGFPP